jgi:hypothetical protein
MPTDRGCQGAPACQIEYDWDANTRGPLSLPHAAVEARLEASARTSCSSRPSSGPVCFWALSHLGFGPAELVQSLNDLVCP